MGGLLAGGSILAAFFGGMVALFSPCCIIFLLPSYLAVAVKNRRWRILPITGFFALGVAAVLLPITLGVSLLSATLARFHTPLYAAGGVLLLALAALALSGRSWSLPGFIHTPELGRTDSAGSFALGLFSGVASSCCAPVLAGIMTLSALSRSLGGAATLGLAYVFGMTFPLLLAALSWDRLRLGERRLLKAHPVRLRLGGRTLHTNTLNLAVAVAFSVMGAMVLGLAATGETTTAPGAQLAMGRWLQVLFGRVLGWLDPVPEPLLGLGLLALAAAIVWFGLRAKPPTPDHGGDSPPAPIPHDTSRSLN